MQTLSDELCLDMFKYYRAGINPEHFGMIQADPVPIKPGDSRSSRFINQYGSTAYELDALHPEQLQQLVKTSIEAFTDMSAYNENTQKEKIDIAIIKTLKRNIKDFIEREADELGI